MTDRDPALIVADVLDLAQRSRILHRWGTANPHMRGADVADILDMLADADSNLDVTEPFWAANPGLPDHPADAVAARALIWGRPTNRSRVAALNSAALARLMARVNAEGES